MHKTINLDIKEMQTKNIKLIPNINIFKSQGIEIKENKEHISIWYTDMWTDYLNANCIRYIHLTDIETIKPKEFPKNRSIESFRKINLKGKVYKWYLFKKV